MPLKARRREGLVQGRIGEGQVGATPGAGLVSVGVRDTVKEQLWAVVSTPVPPPPVRQNGSCEPVWWCVLC